MLEDFYVLTEDPALLDIDYGIFLDASQVDDDDFDRIGNLELFALEINDGHEWPRVVAN